MSKVWVLDYPEALSKYTTYQNVSTQLQSYESKIKDAADVNILVLNSFLDSTSVLQGTYYDTYDAKTAIWYSEADSFSREFIAFKTELANRIKTAQGLRDMWKARINVGHWEGAD